MRLRLAVRKRSAHGCWMALSALVLFGCADDATQSLGPSGSISFSNIIVEQLTDTSIEIRFFTDPAATCVVRYTLDDDGPLDLAATDPMMDTGSRFTTVHAVSLTKLPAQSTIRYVLEATTATGLVGYTTEASFQTLAEAPNKRSADQTVLHEIVEVSILDFSSHYGDASQRSSWGPENAIDFDPGTEWATAGDGDEAYVVVDFGTPQEVVAFSYTSRSMADGSSIIQSVQVTPDDASFSLGPYVPDNPTVGRIFYLEEPVAAATMRVDALVTTGGNTGMADLRFFRH